MSNNAFDTAQMLNDIDDSLVSEAADAGKTGRRRRTWLIPAAAAAVVIAGAALIVSKVLKTPDDDKTAYPIPHLIRPRPWSIQQPSRQSRRSRTVRISRKGQRSLSPRKSLPLPIQRSRPSKRLRQLRRRLPRPRPLRNPPGRPKRKAVFFTASMNSFPPSEAAPTASLTA